MEKSTEATVKQINQQQYNNYGQSMVKMPLEFILFVRNPKISSDHLVYGENKKILVAGYGKLLLKHFLNTKIDYFLDLATNEVCIDFSLLVGIISVWILTQILLLTCGLLMIRRYKRYYKQDNTTQSLEHLHKNFGLGFSNLDSRRVHWADNPDFT